MTQCAFNYAKVLFQLEISEDIIKETRNIIFHNDKLLEAFVNPSIKQKEKNAVIDVIFNKDIRSFLKVLCRNNCIELISEIFDAYDDIVIDNKNMIKATLTFVTKPEDEQIDKIKKFICNNYKKAGVLLELKENPSLLGGFTLSVGDIEYDKSIKGTLARLNKTLVWR